MNCVKEEAHKIAKESAVVNILEKKKLLAGSCCYRSDRRFENRSQAARYSRLRREVDLIKERANSDPKGLQRDIQLVSP